MPEEEKELVKKEKKNPILAFLNKNNFLKTKLVIAVILSGILSVLFEYGFYAKIDPYPSKNRMILVAIAIFFVLLHFIIKLDIMYGFIYKHRYKLACAFLLFVMIGGYSGSSITNYNYYIQSNNDSGRYHTLLGIARTSRSDEWASSTDYILSQGVGSNLYSYFSNKLRGTDTDMFTLTGAPVLDILMLGRPFQIGFLLFGNNMGLSFYWYIRLVAMLLGSFELCMIVTNKNKKISFVGCIITTFSSAVQWWYCLDTLIWSQIILVLFNLFLTTDKRWIKYVTAFGLLCGLLSYVFILYPAWQVPFAYFMLAMGIWIIIKNWKTYKINLHDIIVILVTIICFVLLLLRWYNLSGDTISATMNTAYPGERREYGGGCYMMYSYIFDIFTSFDECLNACEFSSMLSFFPAPMLLGIFYLIRNRKKENAAFIVPMVLLSAFLTVWCSKGFPEWLAKISLMSMSTANRASLALGTVNIYLLVFLMGNIKKDDKWMHWSIASLAAVAITAYAVYKSIHDVPDPSWLGADGNYLSMTKIAIMSVVFGLAFILIFNMNKEKAKNAFVFVACFIAIASGIAVNPIIRTTDIIYTKPISLKFAEILEEDEDAIWISDAAEFAVSNYMVANGLRVLNSTNVYPNLEFYEELLGEDAEEYEEIYNRYAHITVFVTDEASSVELQQLDSILVYINYNDLSKFDIKYIVSTRDLNELEYDIEFDELYYEDGLYIFELEIE